MVSSSLSPLAAALLLLSPNVAATPISNAQNSKYTHPLGIPEVQPQALLFEGPAPQIHELSIDALSQQNATEIPAFIPEGLHVATEDEEAELSRRFIMGADNRVLWTDRSYPFSAMGKIEWNTGVFCSGALIGPRHVATAKHCAPIGQTGVSLRFRPAFYDGDQFPSAAVTTIYHLPGYSVNDPDANACDIKEDWAIFILDARLGDQRGGLGAKVIDQGLIGKNELLHLGYPGDLANGQRPYRQDRITIANRFDCDATGGLSTDADVAGGQSGGPIVSGFLYHYSPLSTPPSALVNSK